MKNYSEFVRSVLRPVFISIMLVGFVFACGGDRDTNAEQGEEKHHDRHADEEHHDEHDDDKHHDEHGGEEHHDEHGTRERPGQAVFVASPEQGIKIGEKVLRRHGVQFRSLEEYRDGAVYRLPIDVVVRSREDTFVYVRANGWVRPIDVQFRGRFVRFATDDSLAGAEVVVTEMALIHLAYLEAFGAAGSGHAH